VAEALARTAAWLTVISACCALAADAQPGQEDAEAERPHLRYYGYYFVESTHYGRHLDEVADYANIHWVQGLPGLRKCAARGTQCILETRWQFFLSGRGEDGKATSTLRPDFRAQWDALADAIGPDIDSVAAFYMLDEPYWNGASAQDLNTAIETVKATFPDKPVMVVFARPSMTDELLVPPLADWAGFDLYASIDQVAHHLALLKSRMHPHQRLFLVPQSFINKAAPTDAALAKLNGDYEVLARSEPLVIGLLNFGLFTNAQPKDIPETIQAQRAIGERIKRSSRAD